MDTNSALFHVIESCYMLSSLVSSQKRKELEAYRKAYLLLLCLPAVPEAPGRFLEGLPGSYWELLFYVGPGKFPEDFPGGSK